MRQALVAARLWPFSLLACAAVGALTWACEADTGPGPGPRLNGCVTEFCVDASTDGSSTTFPNPLEGTTKTATLVKGGYAGPDMPFWLNGHLVFAESTTQVLQLQDDGVTTQVFRSASGGTVGLALEPSGKLVACEANAHRVVRSDPTGSATRTAIATTFGGKPLNSPKDIVVKKDGNIYFTDPDYAADPDAGLRQPKQGVFRIDPQGALGRFAEYDSIPNGIALSPDETTLYVSDTEAGLVRRFSVSPDGSPTNETTFVTTSPQPNGMAIDDAGNLYVSTKNGIEVFSSTAQALGTVTVTGTPNNCGFGGADRRTLYITSSSGSGNPATGVYSIKLNVPGLP